MTQIEKLDENWKVQISKQLAGMSQEQAEFVEWFLNHSFDSLLRNMGGFEEGMGGQDVKTIWDKA